MAIKHALHRYNPFTFQLGIDDASIDYLIERVEYGNRMLMNMPAYSQIVGSLEKQVMVSGISSTDTIEGGDVADAEAESVLESMEGAASNREQRIKNLANAYAYLEDYLAANSEQALLPITEDMMRDLHGIIVQNLTDKDYHPRTYRDNPKGLITRVGDEAHGGRYKPPTAQVDIQTLMGGLACWSVSDEMVAISPLIRASLVHYYFERIHPFSDGNGRVGRMLEKAILAHSGYRGWVKGLDRYYLDQIDNYYLAFNVCRKKEKDMPDTCNVDFISLSLKGMAETIERVHAIASNIANTTLSLALLGELLRTGVINARQHEIIGIIDAAGGELDKQALNRERRYLSLYANLSPATKSRDLNGLIKQELLQKQGGKFIASVTIAG